MASAAHITALANCYSCEIDFNQNYMIYYFYLEINIFRIHETDIIGYVTVTMMNSSNYNSFSLYGIINYVEYKYYIIYKLITPS